MPSSQRGSVRKHGPSWQARFYDETGRRREVSGFPTRTSALAWLEDKRAEVAAIRRGELVTARERAQTVDELLDLFIDKHGRTVDPTTKRNLTTQLRKARAEFGDRHPGSLRRIELEDWRELLPPGSRHHVFSSFRQALRWAAERGLLERNASDGIRNPRRKRHERRPVHPFESWEEVLAVADELDVRYQGLPIVAVGCGLRPEELYGLHRDDIDREAGVLHVRRRYTLGLLKEGGKTAGSVRAVPLRRIVLDALDRIVPRIDTPVLFPAPRGGYINSEKFRYEQWIPAFAAAGIERRRPYDCRHTFATWAIEAGVQLSYLATVMGTSVHELEDTYVHYLKRTDDQLRSALDSYDAGTIP